MEVFMELNKIFYENDYNKAFEYISKHKMTIIEIEPDENGRRFQIVQPKVDETFQKEVRIQELQNLLDKTDYIVTKLAEMQITNNENFNSELARYQETIQNRVAWRSELDRLMNE